MKYMKCMNVLLDKLNMTVLSYLVNQKDNEGNTPLHYAVESWPQTTVEKILGLCGNIAIRNKKGETPLSAVSETMLSDYLDRRA